eukprot:scaffold1384_cov256-Pinguiococcus_pyrenoidosus.AAC.9
MLRRIGLSRERWLKELEQRWQVVHVDPVPRVDLVHLDAALVASGGHEAAVGLLVGPSIVARRLYKIDFQLLVTILHLREKRQHVHVAVVRKELDAGLMVEGELEAAVHGQQIRRHPLRNRIGDAMLIDQRLDKLLLRCHRHRHLADRLQHVRNAVPPSASCLQSAARQQSREGVKHPCPRRHWRA